MSAPLRLNAQQLKSVSRFLELLTKATAETGVRAAVYGSTAIAVDGTALEISYDESLNEYVINDRIGS